MGTLDILFLAVALAMDCFTISIVSGVIMRRIVLRTVLRMSILFGFFQAAMPFLGWMGINIFSRYLMAIDHWIAFSMLAFIGLKMIRDAFSDDERPHFSPTSLRTQLFLAVATSIDALAVGISFACIGYTNVCSLVMPLATIGVMSLLFSIVGYMLGVFLGESVSKRLKPELIGGIILMAIGVKILVSHLLS
ncbi:MAG: manganese efflux pump MntP family protein [Prevotella sp.]